MKKGSLLNALGRLFQEMNNQDAESYVTPSYFRNQFIKYQPKFRGYEQQDAQEFLRYLINGLHDEINVAKGKPRGRVLSPPTSSTEAWDQYKTIDDSELLDAVGGQLSSLITCSVCGNTSTCWDPFSDLSLPLPQKLQECDVERCIEEFTSAEQLDNDEKPMCEKCKKPVRSTKRLGVERTPPLLILHLKRFTNEGYKLTTPRISVNQRLFVNSKSFSLSACVSHHGNSSRSGHYTAYCQYNSKWFHFNDERVSEVRNFAASDLDDCYILFYVETSYTSRL
jgi:ubiquitin C-terminal hydrolase